MKNIYLFCNGSRGDTEPAICLAHYMIEKGDKVKIFCNDKNEYLLKRTNIDYQIVFKNYIDRLPESVSILEYFNEFKDNVQFHLDNLDKIEEKPDAIFGMGDQLGKFVAEKFNCPYYHIVLQYFQVASYAKKTSYMEYFLESLEKLYRKFVSRKQLQIFNQLREKYNLEPINDFMDYIYENENIIVANSLILSNFNYIIHDKIFVSGNLNLTQILDKNINEIDGLQEFMNQDTKYVYLNLGSMSQDVNGSLFKLFENAFKNIDCKVILSCNRKEKSTNPQFFFVSSINPHDLFPKLDLLIHCGGLGVAFKGAYYSVPQIIIPKNFEEPFWAEKVKELGCGDAIDDFKNLTQYNLEETVNRVLNNEMIYYNAKIVSKSIDINGVNNIYEKYLSEQIKI